MSRLYLVIVVPLVFRDRFVRSLPSFRAFSIVPFVIQLSFGDQASFHVLFVPFSPSHRVLCLGSRDMPPKEVRVLRGRPVKARYLFCMHFLRTVNGNFDAAEGVPYDVG